MSNSFIRESRLFTRVKYDKPVSIYYNGNLIGTRNAGNISVGGVLVITEDLGLSAYALVEIELVTKNKLSHPMLRIPGIVNRVNDSELAIEFEVLEKETEVLIKNVYCN